MAYTPCFPESELIEDSVRRTRLERHDILVYRRDDELFAVAGRCTHINRRLPESHEDGVVTCPLHGAQFALRDGRNLRGPLSRDWQDHTPLQLGRVAAVLIPGRTCAPLASYAVRVRDGMVEIDTEEGTGGRRLP